MGGWRELKTALLNACSKSGMWSVRTRHHNAVVSSIKEGEVIRRVT